jgi:hypothetical protein
MEQLVIGLTKILFLFILHNYFILTYFASLIMATYLLKKLRIISLNYIIAW